MTDRLPNFAKLRGEENWLIWKSKMMDYFKALKLWKIVDGTKTCPVLGQPVANPATLDDVEDFETDCSRVMNILNNMVESSLFSVYSKPNATVPQKWTALVEYLDRPTISNKLDLITQLMNIRQDASESIDEYFRRISELITKLAELTYTVDDVLKLGICLNGLLPMYETTSSIYRAKGDQLNWAELHEALRATEKKVSSRLSDVSGARSSALAISPVAGGIMCFGCGQSGHMQSSCPKRGKPGFVLNRYRPAQPVQKKRAWPRKKGKLKVNIAAQEESDCEDGVFGINVHSSQNSENSKIHEEFEFIVDSGATKHIVHDKTLFNEYLSFEKPYCVTLVDGSKAIAEGIGRVRLKMYNAMGQSYACTLHDTLHIPTSQVNLLSVRHSQNLGNSFWFPSYSDQCLIYNASGKEVGLAKDKGNREYALLADVIIPDKVSSVNVADRLRAIVAPENPFVLWHCRAGHIGQDRLKEAAQKGIVRGINAVFPKDARLPTCEDCIVAKSQKKSHPRLGQLSTMEILNLVHSDVSGPVSSSIGGNVYDVTFTDDFSRVCWVFPIQRKSEVFRIFKGWHTAIEKSTGMKLKRFRSDNGGEYVNKEFDEYFRNHGIKHEVTTPYTPQQNGVAERMNKTLETISTALLEHAQKEKKYWAEAIVAASYIRNRMPVKTSDGKFLSPYQRFYGKPPSVAHFRVWGCDAYAVKPKREKFEAKTRKLVFVGYVQNAKGYRLLDPETKKVTICCDVTFAETRFTLDSVKKDDYNDDVDGIRGREVASLPIALPPAEPKVAEPPDAPPPTEPKMVEPASPALVPPLHRSTRDRRVTDRYGDWHSGDVTGSVNDEDFEVQQELIRILSSEGDCVDYLYKVAAVSSDPLTIEDAWSRSDAEEWKKATDSEYKSLLEMETWELVKPPEGRKVIGTKWVFRKKFGADGSLSKYKARLVAKGYSQIPGYDYYETFSPTLRMGTLRSVLTYAISRHLKIDQMDVSTAFLNGVVEEDIYIQQPPGYEKSGEGTRSAIFVVHFMVSSRLLAVGTDCLSIF